MARRSEVGWWGQLTSMGLPLIASCLDPILAPLETLFKLQFAYL